ncbi:MAG: hypothetical protein HY097_04175 [Nitrospinae bacterium]|nr:hypothetical protein [Nitrospinota bacterium]
MKNKDLFYNFLVIFLLFIAAGIFRASMVWGAVGCALDDPDRDVRRFFPESTGYKTFFITIKERGGRPMADKIEEKLGDSFEPIYEHLEVEHPYYQVMKGKENIGWVFGQNQKGEYGLIQVILATDLNGRILNFYYQRLSSPDASKFRQKSFTDRFMGLALKDMEAYNPKTGEIKDPDSPLKKIKNPSQRNDIDFRATMRGIKKNLLLFHTFWKEGGQ